MDPVGICQAQAASFFEELQAMKLDMENDIRDLEQMIPAALEAGSQNHVAEAERSRNQETIYTLISFAFAEDY